MKHHINLYSAEFRPQRQWATLPQMIGCWTVSLLLLMVITGVYAWQRHQSQQALAQIQATLTAKRTESERLDMALRQHQANPRLQQQRLNQQEELTAKQGLMRQLDKLTPQQAPGYATLMANLAQISDPQLALQRFEMTENHLNLAGLARNSQAVPAWIARFKEQPALVGKPFGELVLRRNNEGELTFQLTALMQEKTP